jgi:hypothetical protein
MKFVSDFCLSMGGGGGFGGSPLREFSMTVVLLSTSRQIIGEYHTFDHDRFFLELFRFYITQTFDTMHEDQDC